MQVKKFSLATGTFVMHSVENASKEMWDSNQDICWAGRNVDLHVYVHFPGHFKHVSLWILKKEKKENCMKEWVYDFIFLMLVVLSQSMLVTASWYWRLVPAALGDWD